MTDDDTGGERGTFADDLATIKREGGNLLVTGDVPGTVHRQASGPLLGGTDGPVRRRIVVTVGRGDDLEERLPVEARRDPDHLVVVQSNHLVRGGAATADAGGDTPATPRNDGVERRTTGTDLQLLGETVETAVDDLSKAAEGFSPAELRVCVDGLGPLFSEHGRGDVVAFSHVLTKRIASEGGMGHFHLSLPHDHELVSALEPLFDIVIELKVVEGGPHQRWRTAEDDSGWIPI